MRWALAHCWLAAALSLLGVAGCTTAPVVKQHHFAKGNNALKLVAVLR